MALRSMIDLTNDDRRTDALCELDRCASDGDFAAWGRKWCEGLRELLAEPEAAAPEAFDGEREELEGAANDAEKLADDMAEAGKALIRALDNVETFDPPKPVIDAMNALEELCA